MLIVEDERPIRDLLETVLHDAGYRAETAVHGGEALDSIARELPDLVLTDLMMPVVGGVELCRRLKADPRTSAIPVVLMSAILPNGGVAVGQAEFLAKPFDIAAVEATVARLLPGTGAAEANPQS